VRLAGTVEADAVVFVWAAAAAAATVAVDDYCFLELVAVALDCLEDAVPVLLEGRFAPRLVVKDVVELVVGVADSVVDLLLLLVVSKLKNG